MVKHNKVQAYRIQEYRKFYIQLYISILKGNNVRQRSALCDKFSFKQTDVQWVVVTPPQKKEKIDKSCEGQGGSIGSVLDTKIS